MHDVDINGGGNYYEQECIIEGELAESSTPSLCKVQ